MICVQVHIYVHMGRYECGWQKRNCGKREHKRTLNKSKPCAKYFTVCRTYAMAQTHRRWMRQEEKYITCSYSLPKGITLGERRNVTSKYVIPALSNTHFPHSGRERFTTHQLPWFFFFFNSTSNGNLLGRVDVTLSSYLYCSLLEGWDSQLGKTTTKSFAKGIFSSLKVVSLLLRDEVTGYLVILCKGKAVHPRAHCITVSEPPTQVTE